MPEGASQPTQLSVADVDGDGDIDLLYTAAVLDRVAWLENDGTGSFTNHNITAGADGASSAIAADLDGDGDMDVLSSTRLDDDIAERRRKEPMVWRKDMRDSASLRVRAVEQALALAMAAATMAGERLIPAPQARSVGTLDAIRRDVVSIAV